METEAALYQSSQLCPLYFPCITFPGLAGFTWIFLPPLCSVCFERCLVWGCFSQPQSLLCLWPVMHLARGLRGKKKKKSPWPDISLSSSLCLLSQVHMCFGLRLTLNIWISLQSQQAARTWPGLKVSRADFVVFQHRHTHLNISFKRYTNVTSQHENSVWVWGDAAPYSACSHNNEKRSKKR